MKKILSVVITGIMILPMLFAFPVSAEAPDVPYVLFDFENATVDSDGNLSESVVEDNGTFKPNNTKGISKLTAGMNGTSKAYLHTQPVNNSEYPTITFDGKIKNLIGSEGFRISFYLKLDKDSTQLSNDFPGRICIPLQTTVDGQGDYSTFYLAIDKTAINCGEWVYIEEEFEFNGTFRKNGNSIFDLPETQEYTMSLRFGTEDGKELPAANLSRGTALCYALDDFKVEAIPEKNSFDSEAFETIYSINTDTSARMGNMNKNGATMTHITNDKPNGTEGCFAVTHTENTAETNDTQEPFIEDNCLYRISFWAKALDSDNVGTVINNYIKDNYRLDKTTYNTGEGTHVNHTVFYKTATLTASWVKYEVYFKHNIKTHDRSKARMGFQIIAPEGKAVNIAYADFKIEKIASLTNGGFENLSYPVAVNPNLSDGAKDDSQKYAEGLYGWFADGVTITADTQSYVSGTQAAKIVVNSQNGSPAQGIFVENNTDNIISFYAKGEGDSVGKNINVVLDRSVTQVDSTDLYTVPDKETLTAGTLTDQWTKYTIRYNPSFAEPTESLELTARQKIGPRSPFIRFSVDGGAQGLTYYLDDVKFAPVYNLPYVTDIAYSGSLIETNRVSISYNPQYDKGEVSTNVVNIYSADSNGKRARIYTATTSERNIEYEIPSSVVGYNLVAEIISISNDGNLGAAYDYTLGTVLKEYECNMTLSENNDSSGVTANVSIINNKLDNSDIYAVLVVVMKSEDNTLVKYDWRPIEVLNGETEEKTLVLTYGVVDQNLPSITVAEAYLWKCKKPDNAGDDWEPTILNMNTSPLAPLQRVIR